eukprot:364303-Chlamydomonas_euryale.AAC.10
MYALRAWLPPAGSAQALARPRIQDLALTPTKHQNLTNHSTIGDLPSINAYPLIAPRLPEVPMPPTRKGEGPTTHTSTVEDATMAPQCVKAQQLTPPRLRPVPPKPET